MKDNTLISIIVALIASATSIAVAVMNNNAMKDLLYTEIHITQTAQAQATSVPQSSFYLPTLLPSQSTAAPVQTSAPIPTALPTPGVTSLPADAPSPAPNTPSGDALTVRFRELGIIVSLFILIGTTVLLFFKIDASSILYNLIAEISTAILATFPFFLFWLRYSFAFPSLPWMTVLFSTFMPVSALIWLGLFKNDALNDRSPWIFLAAALIAPFVTSFGFTFWSLGTALLNSFLSILFCGFLVGLTISTEML